MITQFQGEYRWLSNFWACSIQYKGKVYPSVEHFYVAMKTLDEFDRETIRLTESAGKVKRLGKTLTLRNDWEDVKVQVMWYALREKFGKNNPELAAKLISTGDIYIQEGNTWGDKFWGVDLKSGRGENNLGKLLMKRRGQLNG